MGVCAYQQNLHVQWCHSAHYLLHNMLVFFNIHYDSAYPDSETGRVVHCVCIIVVCVMYYPPLETISHWSCLSHHVFEYVVVKISPPDLQCTIHIWYALTTLS